MMFGYGMAGGFGWVVMVLWWVVFIGGVVALVRWLASGGGSGRAALDILKERYARGEIDQEQFQRMKNDLMQ